MKFGDIFFIFVISKSYRMEGAGFFLLGFIFLLLLLAVIIVVAVACFVYFIFASSVVVVATSKNGSRFPNLLAFLTGLVSFVFSFFLIFVMEDGYTIETDGFLEPTSYVQVVDDYRLTRSMYEYSLWEINKDSVTLVADVDCVALRDSLLYGHSSGSYFAIDLVDGTLLRDSSWTELHLPSSCERTLMVEADRFYNQQRKNHTVGFARLYIPPFVGALLVALVCGFVVRMTVKWLQNILLKWRDRRKRRRGEDEFSLN